MHGRPSSFRRCSYIQYLSRHRLALFTAAISVAGGVDAASADTLTWDKTVTYDGGPSDGGGTWKADDHWWNSSIPVPTNQVWASGDTAVLGASPGSNSYTLNLGSDITAGGIIFANRNYTIQSSSYVLTVNTGGVTANSAGKINAPVVLGGNQTWAVASDQSLYVAGQVNGNGNALTIDGPGDIYLDGVLTNASLNKNGDGIVYVSTVNDYGGPTAINNGKFILSDGSVTSNVVINGGLLSGTGSTGTVTVNAGGTISAGSYEKYDGVEYTYAGTLNTGEQTWNGGGTYVWKISLINPPGGEPGWDKINVSSGNLNINSSSNNKFKIAIAGIDPSEGVPGYVLGFDNTRSQSWQIASAAGSINGFSADKIDLDKSEFVKYNDKLGGGHFSVTTVGSDLVLNFTPGSAISLSDSGVFWNLATDGAVNVTGSGHAYHSETDDLTGDARFGSVLVDNNINGPVMVMLWLKDTYPNDLATIDELVNSLDASKAGYDIALASAGEGDALYGQIQDLHARYGDFTALVRFDAGLAAGGAFNWDFAGQSDIYLDKIAVVPEPGSAGLIGIGLLGLLLPRRRRRN